jgi:hypothetical protein
MRGMRAKFIKIAGLTVALAACGLVHMVSIHAQPGTTKSSPPPATTNWVGYLVAGQTVSIDPMPGTGPQPTTVRHVEIGLRSDGVVVWRMTPKTK